MSELAKKSPVVGGSQRAGSYGDGCTQGFLGDPPHSKGTVVVDKEKTPDPSPTKKKNKEGDRLTGAGELSPQPGGSFARGTDAQHHVARARGPRRRCPFRRC